ncbi:MAG: hypothetical protein HY283_09815 [Nitrospirae bacterium]|nr:hypothetical protein [Nitrospirota bacterium]
MISSLPRSIAVFRIRPTLAGVVLAATLFAGVAAAEEPPAAAPAPAVVSLPDLTADLQTTTIDRSGHTAISTVHIYRSGELIRYEHLDIVPPEISVMDYGKLKEYRIFNNDKIYFEAPIGNRIAFKAQRERLIRPEPPPDLVEKRIILREDTLEGHPCNIVLLIRSVKDRKELGTDYTLLWEAQDLKGQPIRVAYHQPNLSLLIMDLRNAKFGPVDPILMQPPTGFANMNPY